MRKARPRAELASVRCPQHTASPGRYARCRTYGVDVDLLPTGGKLEHVTMPETGAPEQTSDDTTYTTVRLSRWYSPLPPMQPTRTGPSASGVPGRAHQSRWGPCLCMWYVLCVMVLKRDKEDDNKECSSGLSVHVPEWRNRSLKKQGRRPTTRSKIRGTKSSFIAAWRGAVAPSSSPLSRSPFLRCIRFQERRCDPRRPQLKGTQLSLSERPGGLSYHPSFLRSNTVCTIAPILSFLMSHP